MVNTPRRIPRQARSRATVEVILEAAALVLAREGFAGTTTNRVAERAGVSVGSLYQYFPNREALVRAVAHRRDAAVHEAVGCALAATRGLDLRSVIARTLHAVVNAHANDLPLRRALAEAAPQLGRLEWVIDPGAHRHTVTREMLDAHAGQLRRGFDRAAATFLVPTVVGASITAATLSRPAAFASGELVRELTEMVSNYVAGR